MSTLDLFKDGQPAVITIFATDHRYAIKGTPTPAAYSIAFQHTLDGFLLHSEARAVPKESSSQNEALVLATLHAVQAGPASGRIEIRTTSEFIAKTINEWMSDWRNHGWKNAQGNDPHYVEVWKSIDQTIKQRAINCTASHVRKDERKACPVFAAIVPIAERERDRHGQKIGAALSGFGPVS